MTDDQPSDREREASTTNEETLGATAVSSSYKVLGELNADSGAGVLGKNTADSGTPIGVEGAVPNNSSGYGLSTPNDARVGGSLTDADGNAHLTLKNGGPLAVRQSFDLGGNALVDNGTAIWDAESGADVATDTASTFGEADVTVTHSKTQVANGAIELAESVSRTQDDSTVVISSKVGLEFEPHVDLSAITATISSRTNDESTVYILDSSGTQLASEPSPGAGNSVRLTASLSAGNKYYILVDNSGDSYTAGGQTSVSFPYTSSVVDITAGASGTSAVADAAYAISKLAFDVTSGAATVTFPRPSSVRQWRTATFQDDPDGETVEVYVETSSDGGSTWSDWQSAPIGPGTDLSAISRDNRVRYRVELSRDSSSNRPRVTVLSRQWRP